jgi:hypothetical protein
MFDCFIEEEEEDVLLLEFVAVLPEHARFAAVANEKKSDAIRFGPRDAVTLSFVTRRRLTIAE